MPCVANRSTKAASLMPRPEMEMGSAARVAMTGTNTKRVVSGMLTPSPDAMHHTLVLLNMWTVSEMPRALVMACLFLRYECRWSWSFETDLNLPPGRARNITRLVIMNAATMPGRTGVIQVPLNALNPKG